MNEEFVLEKGIGVKSLEMICSAVFPNKCLFCGKILLDNRALCGDCDGGTVSKRDINDIKSAYIACEYDEGARNVIFRFKYEGKRLLSKPMANLIFKKADNITGDFLIPVPLHKKRLKERGFNQAGLLAAELAELTKLPAYDGLRRVKETEKQFELGPEQREANMDDAFALCNGFCVDDADILLVDDILTTGATVRACAKVLKQAGARSVSLIVFASAVL